MLMELRQVDEQPERRALGPRDRVCPQRPGLAHASRSPPEPAEPPGDQGRECAGNARAEGSLVEAGAPRGLATLEPAPGAQPLHGIVARIRTVEERRRPRVEARERDEIPAIVTEDARQ